MMSTDKFLVPGNEEHKISSVVFEAPMSELKGNYIFCLLILFNSILLIYRYNLIEFLFVLCIFPPN